MLSGCRTPVSSLSAPCLHQLAPPPLPHSTSPLRLSGPRPDTSSEKPDPGCARHCGRKTTWALYFSSKMAVIISLCLHLVTGGDFMRNEHLLRLHCRFYVVSVIDEYKLPFDMPFTMQCTSSDCVSLGARPPCQSEGWPPPSGPPPPPPCNSWPC